MPSLDPAFLRKKFLLRQKHFAISEKYVVWDEQGKELLFVQRPAHLIRGCLAALAGIGAAAVVGAGLGFISSLLPQSVIGVGIIVTVLTAIAVLMVVAISLSPKRHVHFYRDNTMQELLLQVDQDQKFAPIIATYTVKDPQGGVLAKLKKNYLYNIIRKRWYILGPDDQVLSLVEEDSLIMALVRRFIVAWKTDFIFQKGMTEQVIARFIRKWTLLDRYVLDLTEDQQNYLDPRVALAMGVMLDTGERR